MMKTFYISIAGVNYKHENHEDIANQVRNVALDVVSGLNYILANKYKIKMIDYNCLKVEVKNLKGDNDG